MAPVRFGSVTVSGWNGSRGSGFRFPGGGLFCVSVEFNRERRFRFRFPKNGSGGSGSSFGSWKNGSGGSGFRFQFGS